MVFVHSTLVGAVSELPLAGFADVGIEFWLETFGGVGSNWTCLLNRRMAGR